MVDKYYIITVGDCYVGNFHNCYQDMMEALRFYDLDEAKEYLKIIKTKDPKTVISIEMKIAFGPIQDK